MRNRPFLLEHMDKQKLALSEKQKVIARVFKVLLREVAIEYKKEN